MYDSSYYNRQMNNYLELISKSETDKQKFNDLISYFSNIERTLPSISGDLKEAENNFLNGGFVSDNETFDKGIIKNSCEDINNISNEIIYIITKANKKMIELDNNISKYKEEYSIASENYHNALLKEQGD